ncbi:MAG: HAMP domain-containing protein [Acidobacteria bacterium]|nr:HAMP domain-containing protein [Acidobacteriota bacterium]
MGLPRLFYSFRTRLLLVMALLLIATLGVQYYFGRVRSRQRAVIVAGQEQALTAAIALANESITSSKYMFQLDKPGAQSLLERQKGRVVNVLVVRDGDGRIEDSLDPEYRPATLESGEAHYDFISDTRNVQLPNLVDAGEASAGFRRLRPSLGVTPQPVSGEPRTFAIPLQTDDGLVYIVIVLGTSPMSDVSSYETLRQLGPTLAIMLISTLGAVVLVWRFTRPLNALSRGAQRVAAGDFSFRVPGADRRDEVGRLTATFNEMIEQLGRMRELETQFKQTEQSAVIGRLASAIAHEIRNPLNYINLALDQLRIPLAPSDPQKRALVEKLTLQLKAEVARINTRITEFLKYTRPANLDLKPLDLREAVRDALSMVEVQAAEIGVETRFEEDGAVPPVLGDREALRSLFTNLIINGMHAMEGGGGRLTVSLSAENGLARVRVSDTGVGIDAGHLPKIFEPYFSTKETGTGLGLAIVKKAVDEHDGSIRVESKSGEGTTFTVEIPIRRE